MTISLGIDVAEARKGLDLVAVDDDRTLVLRRAHATVADVVEVIRDVRPDVVCIDSPPAWASTGQSRAAERQLRTLGITAFSTPTDPGAHSFYQWMRVGFSIFAAISHSYPRYRTGSVQGTAVEVFPEASAVLLAGRLRPRHESKRHFRRDVLADHAIETAALRTIDAVDAALAALTGLLALQRLFSSIGDADEGVIVVPVVSLPRQPLRRALTPDTPDQHPVVVSPAPLGAMQCQCGCGAIVRRRFLPGHDAKLKSELFARQARGDTTATDQLRALGWLT